MQQFRLTPDEVTKFRAQGWIGPFPLYTPEEARERYKQIRAQLFDRDYAVYDLPPNSAIANYDRHLDVNLLSEHVCRPEVVGRLNSILGPDLICWRTEMFPKYPGDEGTDWHQADTFAHASGKPQIVWPGDQGFGGAVTVWTALTEASEENGCLRFMPGTHEEMFYDESKKMAYDPTNVNALEKDGIKRGFFGYDYRSLQKDPNWKPDESKAVSIVMQPGEFVIFWSTLMHSSFPNSTKDRTRLGYTSRYVPASVQVYPDTDTVDEYGSKIRLDKYGVVLVSGEDHYGHNRRVQQNARGMAFPVANPSTSPEAPEREHVYQTVGAVVQDVLGRDVALDDDFFAVGGSSLSAALIATQLEHRLGREVPLRLLLENPCIRDFADKLGGTVAYATQ